MVVYYSSVYFLEKDAWLSVKEEEADKKRPDRSRKNKTKPKQKEKDEKLKQSEQQTLQTYERRRFEGNESKRKKTKVE